MIKLVLLRHGESLWNKENIFTGWTDVDLSEKGIAEAHNAGKILSERGFVFDIAFTSVLKKAIRTLWIVLDEMDLMWIPVVNSWRLNERHYGALQGQNKKEVAKEHGARQVLIWRRSYNVRPPLLKKTDEMYPGNDSRYKGLSENEIPLSESLKDTLERFLPFWHDTIVPTLKEGKRVIISGHGTCLRSLVKHLDNISDEDVLNLNIPTGIPLVYELDEKLKPIKHYYLGEPEDVKKAIEHVVSQIKI